jgi:hypothetical protein
LRHGLTLWRQRVTSGFALPRRWTADLWSPRALGVEERLESVEAALREQGAVSRRGGDFARWDLEVSGGLLGAARMFVAVEHHGDGRQLLRVRWWPRCSMAGLLLTIGLAGLALAAVRDQSPVVAAVFGAATLLLAVSTVRQCAAATAAFLAVVRGIERVEKIGVATETGTQLQLRSRATALPFTQPAASRPPSNEVNEQPTAH